MSGLPFFMEGVKIVPGLSNQQCSVAGATDRISLEGYKRVAVFIAVRQGNANATDITFHKSTTDGTTVEDTSNMMTHFWTMEDVTVGTTADTWTKGTAAATFSTSASGSGTSYYLIDIGADELPDSTSQVYKFIEVNTAGGHASNYLDVVFFLYQPRYMGATMPTAQS